MSFSFSSSIQTEFGEDPESEATLPPNPTATQISNTTLANSICVMHVRPLARYVQAHRGRGDKAEPCKEIMGENLPLGYSSTPLNP